MTHQSRKQRGRIMSQMTSPSGSGPWVRNIKGYAIPSRRLVCVTPLKLEGVRSCDQAGGSILGFVGDRLPLVQLVCKSCSVRASKPWSDPLAVWRLARAGCGACHTPNWCSVLRGWDLAPKQLPSKRPRLSMAREKATSSQTKSSHLLLVRRSISPRPSLPGPSRLQHRQDT